MLDRTSPPRPSSVKKTDHNNRFQSSPNSVRHGNYRFGELRGGHGSAGSHGHTLDSSYKSPSKLFPGISNNGVSLDKFIPVAKSGD